MTRESHEALLPLGSREIQEFGDRILLPAAERLAMGSNARRFDLVWTQREWQEEREDSFDPIIHPSRQVALDIYFEDSGAEITYETQEISAFDEAWSPQVLQERFMGDKTRSADDDEEDDGDFFDTEARDLDLEDYADFDPGRLAVTTSYEFTIPNKTITWLKASGVRKQTVTFVDDDDFPIDTVNVVADSDQRYIRPSEIARCFEDGRILLDVQAEEERLWRVTIDDVLSIAHGLQSIGLASPRKAPLTSRTLARLRSKAA